MSNTNMTDPIKTLADRFDLDGPGINSDWYSAHGKPCLTKQGIQRIAAALDIVFSDQTLEVTPPLVVVTGTATHFSKGDDAPPLEVFEVGSCRFDGSKNTPERTFAPEMAFKRWKGRAVSALACRLLGIHGTVYTEDEMAHIGDTGGAAPSPAPASSAQPANRGARQPGGHDGPPTTRSGESVSRGDWSDALPTEWADILREFSVALDVDAAELEPYLLAHCAKFEDKEKPGRWSTGGGAYSTFVAIHARSAKWALRVKKEAEAALDVAKEHGGFTFEGPKQDGTLGRKVFGVGVRDEPAAGSYAAQDAQQQEVPDDVPF
jgi:hypothetical protein